MTTPTPPVDPTGTHTEHEDDPWTIDIGDHAKRTDSPTYLDARKYMIAAVKTVQPWFFGDKPYQDHHGGGIWLRDVNGWFLVKNLAGVEWSAIPAGDPAKFEALRQNAERVVAGFPLTEKAYVEELGMSTEHLAILHTPITDATGVSTFTDSFWNASVPLPAPAHTGTVKATGDTGGVHHYPTPITDIQWIKRQDFTLFVVDAGRAVAVVPFAPGDRRATVVYDEQDALDHAVLPEEHPIAKAAFATAPEESA